MTFNLLLRSTTTTSAFQSNGILIHNRGTSRIGAFKCFTPPRLYSQTLTASSNSDRTTGSTTTTTTDDDDIDETEASKPRKTRSGKPIWDDDKSPWYHRNIKRENGKINTSRFRQHVNPLARKFQMQTELAKEWPNDGTFDDPSLPLHIDIGCGKGGFLLDLAKKRKQEQTHEKRNYLGLEIRPSVAQYAKERIPKWNLAGSLDFIGCNANVDLDRILASYHRTDGSGGRIALVSVQYPDPHFKKQHRKRRVVTPELVSTLAKFIPEGGELFLQSDVKEVLDGMRLTVREEGHEYFEDALEDLDEYLEENPIGVPTERELSVLDQGLNVYRTIFRRNDRVFEEEED